MAAEARLVRRAVGASFLLYVALGLPDGVLGTVWPNLRDHFERTDGAFGAIVFATAVGYGTGGLTAGRVGPRLGPARVLPWATGLVVVALAGLAAAPAWWVLVVAFGLVGFGWGVGDATVNAWMAITHGPREMGLLHASYGIGTFLGPLLATAFVADGTAWRPPYLVCLAASVAAVVALVASRPGFAGAQRRAEVADGTGTDRGSNRLMLTMVAWFAVYVGVEVTIGQWAFTLLTEGRGRSDVAAGIWVAAYWGGLTGGRFLLAAVGDRIRAETTMRVTSGLAVLAAAGLWADDGTLGALMLPVLGVLLAPMFPVMIGRTAVYLGGDRATRAVGYQIAATPLGFTAIPALVGLLADRRGIGVAPPVALGGLVVLVGLWWAIERQVGPRALSRSAS